ncbi:virion protein [Vibrio phage VPy01]|nr:virion protein [Vibrio phage VPy01]
MAYATENYGSARTDLITAIKNRFEAAGFTIAGHDGEYLCIKLKDDLYIEYRCTHFKYVTRSGRQRYKDSLHWEMGTSHSGARVSGDRSEEEGQFTNYSGWSGNLQHVPLPGKIHFCKTDVAGKDDYLFCLENTADGRGASFLGAELSCVDAQFGAHSHFYLAGHCAISSRDDSTNPGPFHQTGDGSGPGYIRRQNADGTFHSYERAGYGYQTTSTHSTINSYLSTGSMGFYDGIDTALYFDPSLTTILVPAIWGCTQPKATSGDGRYSAPPKGEFPQFKIGSMKYAGIGDQLTLDGKTYRLFPRVGKGGSNVTAFAIRET